MVTFIDSFDEMPVLPVTEEMRSFAPTVEPPSQQSTTVFFGSDEAALSMPNKRCIAG